MLLTVELPSEPWADVLGGRDTTVLDTGPRLSMQNSCYDVQECSLDWTPDLPLQYSSYYVY